MADKDSIDLQDLEHNDMAEAHTSALGGNLNVKTDSFAIPANEFSSLFVLDDHLTALREVLESESYQVALVPRHERVLWGHLRPRSGNSILSRPSAVLLPFSWNQLVARVCEFVRDTSALAERRVVRFEDFSVDFSKMEVSRSSGETIMLTAQEFKTLKCFLLNPDRVFSRDELLNEAWGYQHYPSTRTVDNHVFKLRQKFEADPAHPVHFLTVHAIGYKFVL